MKHLVKLAVCVVLCSGKAWSQDAGRPDIDKGRPRPTERGADKYDRGRYKERFNDAAKGTTRAASERDAQAPRNTAAKADKYDRNQYRDRFNTAANPPPDNRGGGSGGGGGGSNGGGGGGKGGGAAAPPAGPKPGGAKPR